MNKGVVPIVIAIAAMVTFPFHEALAFFLLGLCWLTYYAEIHS